MRKIFLSVFVGAIFLYAGTLSAHAARLSFVSDTITDSRPLFPADHTIVFKAPNAIPASGHINVAFENDPFSIDPSYSYADVHFAVSLTSPYTGFVDRSLAAAADASNDGVVVDAAGGSITITLSSGSGIAAGSYIKVTLGSETITNPSSTASYRILLATTNAASAEIDSAAAMVAILPGIAAEVNTDKVNPAVITNGLPSGTIPSNISGVLLSLNTDTFANCRYATVPGVSYDSMTNNFDHTLLGTFHTASITGITRGTTYNYYVRCVDFAGNKNPTDYIISFTAGDPTGTGSGGGTAGSGGGGGGGGGGGEPYPPGPSLPSLTLRGVSFPGSIVTVLQDGTLLAGVSATAGNDGSFSINIPSLAQGTYTFTLVVSDTSGHRISSYTTTITIISGTTNTVTSVILPPEVVLSKTTIAPGGTIVISGQSEPKANISIQVISQAGLQNPINATATSDATGAWSYTLSTAGFAIDTYQISAQSTVNGFSSSKFSDISYLGVGQAPVPKTKTGDINGDGKVNLVDFSILLFHWGSNFPAADLNSDGTVNLTDFSILLFHWTG